MIKRLSHICFIVRDLDVSLTFYRDKLGFEEAFEFRDASGRWFGQYLHIGGESFLELFLGEPTEPDPSRSYQHFCLQVDDLEAERNRIVGRGVEMTEIKMGSDNSLQSWTTDPDGNRIEFHQYTPQSKQGPWAT